MMLTAPSKIIILINNVNANYETKMIFSSSKKSNRQTIILRTLQVYYLIKYIIEIIYFNKATSDLFKNLII